MYLSLHYINMLLDVRDTLYHHDNFPYYASSFCTSKNVVVAASLAMEDPREGSFSGEAMLLALNHTVDLLSG